jgi:hypothetical protein
MKKATARMFFCALLLLLAGQSFGKTQIVTLQGIITDTQCAFNVHAKGGSHDLMVKSGLGGASEKACTLHCVKQMGGDYVLVVKTQVYRLDDQVQPEKFAGDKVKVTGSLIDAKTNTLHVISIEDAGRQAKVR